MRTRGIGTSQPAPKTHHWPAWLTMSCTSQTHCLNKLLDPLLLLPHYMPILPLRRMRNAARNAACRRECGIPQAQAYTCLSLTQSHYLNFNISPSPRRPRPRPRCALSWRRAGRVPAVGVVRRPAMQHRDVADKHVAACAHHWPREILRDVFAAGGTAHGHYPQGCGLLLLLLQEDADAKMAHPRRTILPVSYTHLTLPTI